MEAGLRMSRSSGCCERQAQERQRAICAVGFRGSRSLITLGQREGLPIQARWFVAPLLFRIHPLSLCPHLAS